MLRRHKFERVWCSGEEADKYARIRGLGDPRERIQLLQELKEWSAVRDQRRKRIVQAVQSIEQELQDVELGIENVLVGMQLLSSTRDIEYVRRGRSNPNGATRKHMLLCLPEPPFIKVIADFRLVQRVQVTDFDSNKGSEEAQQEGTAGPSESLVKPEDAAAKLLEAVRIDSMQSDDEGDIGGVYGGPLPHLMGTEEYVHDIDCGLPAKWIVRSEDEQVFGAERPQSSSPRAGTLPAEEVDHRGKAGKGQPTMLSHQSETEDLRSALDAALAGRAETDSEDGEVVNQPVSPARYELPGSADRQSYFSQLAAEGLFAYADPTKDEVDSSGGGSQ